MDSTLLQILLVLAAAGIFLITLPAYLRIKKNRAAGETMEEEENPLDLFLEEHLRRGRRPNPAEVLLLKDVLERENWPVPTITAVIAEFDERREALAQAKLQRSKKVTTLVEVDNSEQWEQGQGQEQQMQQTEQPGQAQNVQPLTTMRAATLEAISKLPSALPPLPRTEPGSIPLLYDGSRWHYMDLVPGSDWVICGAKRSGKGNTLQNIALHALRFGPAFAQVIVLDAKAGLDYGFCDEVAHAELYANTQIMDGINRALDIMEERNERFKQAKVRNHFAYQSKTGQRVPLLLVIADEIADFTDEQRDRIATLVRMGGAAGIVNFCCTQYPTADVLPSQIQANTPNRMVFRLASAQYVKVALRREKDEGGQYDPSLITQSMKGVGVWRRDGNTEVLGRCPEISEELRDAMVAEIVARWPKTTSVSAETFPSRKLVLELRNSGNTLETGLETGLETTGNNPFGGYDDLAEDRIIAALLQAGLSKNAILADRKGNRARRLAQINRIEASLKTGPEAASHE